MPAKNAVPIREGTKGGVRAASKVTRFKYFTVTEHAITIPDDVWAEKPTGEKP